MASRMAQGSASVQSGSVSTVTITPLSGGVIAVLRVAMGFVFMWPFLDKLFGLSYSTPSERAWINGGSPTKGFLSGVDVGPFESFFHAIAGAWWANILFMAALFAIGLALILGVALRLAAASGTLLLVMMWAASWPMARFNSAGEATGSSNPFLDDHLVYALVLIVLAILAAGNHVGLGRWWAGVTGGKAWLQ